MVVKKEAELSSELDKIYSEIIVTKNITEQQIELLKKQNKKSLKDLYSRLFEVFSSGGEIEEGEINTLNKIQNAIRKAGKLPKVNLQFESKPKLDRDWLKSFMLIYNEASPLIDTMTELNSEGQPANPASLHEGYPELLALRQSIKDMPKPSDKELRKAKDDFEKTVSMCIKAQEMTKKMLDDIDHGAKLAARMHVASIVGYVNYAATYRKYLIKRLTKIGVF
jgi:hypothetical protein